MIKKKKKAPEKFQGSFAIGLSRIMNNPQDNVITDLDVVINKLRDQSLQKIIHLKSGASKDKKVHIEL